MMFDIPLRSNEPHHQLPLGEYYSILFYFIRKESDLYGTNF